LNATRNRAASSSRAATLRDKSRPDLPDGCKH
jgi:hypothetical protein